jgi:TetR/AcrR family transcriptional repressor of nem operon
MARSKEFEPANALNKAMLLFWEKGYADTSMDDLVHATGVSRYGFYTTFGDKRDLFIKAMEHYASTMINMTLGPLETPEASVPEIRKYFDFLMAHCDRSQGQVGCLIGNTALESVPGDEAVAVRIDRHFARMRGAFLNALKHAAQRGEIDAGADVEALADFLVGAALGYLGYVRAKMPPQAIQRFIRLALARFF